MYNLKFTRKNQKGVTLVALVVTIVILLILAGITVITLSGENGIISKAMKAKEATQKGEATDIINLKITNIQIDSFAKTQKMPTLQYLADSLCEDNEIEYVELESKKLASLEKINVGKNESIFTKLKQYPYEFEINSSLQLASINGVKIASNNENGETVSKEQYDLLQAKVEELENKINSLPQGVTKEEYNSLKTNVGNLESKVNGLSENSLEGIGTIYEKTFANVNITANTSNTVATITLPAGKYVMIGYAYYIGNDLRYHLTIDSGGEYTTCNSAYDNKGYVGMEITNIVDINEEKTFEFIIWPSDKSVTLSTGFIRAIKIK